MFTEGHVEVDGVRVRYVEAGQGTPLVHVHGADGMPLTPAHDLLARRFRVIALELPGLGQPSEQHRRGREVAMTIGRAIDALGIDGFDLMATAEASTAALWLAREEPERVRALVLEAPTAMCRDGAEPRDPDLEHRLPELATPTLVLFGTGDRASSQQTGRVYVEQMPNSHLVFVYDAAHAIGHDRPEAFAEVVADFLERHEAFVISRTPTVIHP
jgi:pimeloyl-ACP methyl ester carboxylesterase